MGYSLWSYKVLDMTGQGDTHIHTHAEFCLVFKLTNLTSIGVSLA